MVLASHTPRKQPLETEAPRPGFLAADIGLALRVMAATPLLSIYLLLDVTRLLNLVLRVYYVKLVLSSDLQDILLQLVHTLQSSQPQLVNGELLVMAVCQQLDFAIVLRHDEQLPECLQQLDLLLLHQELLQDLLLLFNHITLLYLKLLQIVVIALDFSSVTQEVEENLLNFLLLHLQLLLLIFSNLFHDLLVSL